MIARRYIEEWKEFAPWPDNAQVEQDLIIERALVEMFSDEMIRENLAFRGGTAFHKLFLKPQVRYSEDIDLVQIQEGPINPILKRIRERLDFLGTKRIVKQKANNNTIVYRFESEIAPIINMALKIEINCREHFNVLGLQSFPFKVENSWFNGECDLTTYQLEELLGTKLRALYQRRKGRDLFDLYWALTNHEIDKEKLLHCYRSYMKFSSAQPPTPKMFIANMDEKLKDKEFTDDIHVILRPGIEYNNEIAYELVKRELLENI
ncbi:nucleotidyl transferase AbiEii/AbiGii toxin family protein [Mucilaginibacter rubeus]|uniref:Nucleotidyl transferase AbiEii/AbiGii toxin family protein n=1 Tax=Mucilaginibacter rubeus TaxID=2027860 RepID=A0AAE6JJV5_9SPHI|nr:MULTISPECIES: nucleotidyl transferase AbiEii/AbiGii toxin family protein [Mucilaginibacter]QEM07254.1 nucleotidyl transferase AbiEii/AbiGii toxin family protein [Mucilaginibacter rubeus]QEM19709.1 nucleotidyl transferase AbiEii/AbiGii toxin family protein [Mucilaginibacter gossypii]QTE43593.1 nucleotidyl transferase AbiEii/AbiGii toxin family protein [Mucilaginibacter rubeus]QTE50193.1 nucleotidyl transferase AbiEii/AbiGii toxin family protein [Mucilaginibacter rubeus]QTE55281.1 nucleotidyl